MRGSAIRDGIEDYTMIAALQSALEDARARGKTGDAVDRAEALLGERASAIAQFCGLDDDGTTPGREGLPGARRLADDRWDAVRDQTVTGCEGAAARDVREVLTGAVGDRLG